MDYERWIKPDFEIADDLKTIILPSIVKFLSFLSFVFDIYRTNISLQKNLQSNCFIVFSKNPRVLNQYVVTANKNLKNPPTFGILLFF